jgi:rubrerythrin
MLDKNSDQVQAIQQILGRTYKGREVQKRAKGSTQAWQQNIETDFGKTECNMCGLILKSNYYINGCPNCGSTDYQSIKQGA